MLAGAVLGVVELVFLCVAGPARLIPATRPTCDRIADKLLALERARLATWLGHPTAEAGGGYGFLVVRAAAGLVTGYGVTAGLLLSGLLLFGGSWELLTGASESVPFDFPGVKVISNIGVMGLLTGGFLLVLTLAGALAAGGAERRLAERLLGPSRQELMRRRIAELTATRSGIVRAVDDERRRIERDLHDGVQQRRRRAGHAARPRPARPPAGAAELVDQALHRVAAGSGRAAQVAWRIYPTALDELGLRAALAGVAERSGVPVSVTYGLAGRPVVRGGDRPVLRGQRGDHQRGQARAAPATSWSCWSEDERAVRRVVSDDGRGRRRPGGRRAVGARRRVPALDGGVRGRQPARRAAPGSRPRCPRRCRAR